MWKTQRKTARGWELDEKFPGEKWARKYWRELTCKTPLRLVNDQGEVVDEMNTEPNEKGSDDEQLQTD